MSRPARVWETTYRHDRRKNAHRCRACNRVLKDGDEVLMTRVGRWVGGTYTRAIHLDCADTTASSPTAPVPYTYRDLMGVWAQPTPEDGHAAAQRLEAPR